MELAIPLIALGGLFVISNSASSASSASTTSYAAASKQKEPFVNQGIRTNLQTKPTLLPNVDIPPQNYPLMNNRELVNNTVQSYPNPNTATNDYFDQNLYEQTQRQGTTPVGNTIQSVHSLSGNYMSSKEFIHNNMVPFTGSKPHGQTYHNDLSETILDNYSGNGSQTIKKIEQAPLFQPQDNVQWTYGTPSTSDFMQSRQNPVNRNNMVKPFESIHVGPGLNQGYSAQGSLGFNSGMEARDKWLPKTVDELRVVTNPKQEYELTGLQGPAQTLIKNVGLEGKMEKYRPDTFFVNSQDRWLTTTGAEKAGRMVAEEIQHPSHRNDTTQFLHGTPNSTLKTASYTPIQYEASKRIGLEGFDAGPSCATTTAPLQHQAVEQRHKSHTNYVNNRCMNAPTPTFGTGFSSAVGAVIAPLMDFLRPSRKEEYSCNQQHMFGNLGSSVPQSYVSSSSSSSDCLAPTVKETTLYEPAGYINNQRDNAGYQITPPTSIHNQRETVNHDQWMGMSSNYGQRAVDGMYRQTNNETKEVATQSRMNHGNTSQFNATHPTMNMSRSDTDRENNRLWAPQVMIASGPSTQTYGRISATPQQTPSFGTAGSKYDRISPELLDAFKSNPYTHSLCSAV